MSKIIFLILVFVYSLAATNYKVLVITNVDPSRNDHIFFKKALKAVKRDVEKRFKNIKIIYQNINYSNSNSLKDIKKIKLLLKKEQFLFIIAPGISKAFEMIAPFLPKNTPVITASSSITSLKKYKGDVYSLSTPTKYYKAKDLVKLQKILNFDYIINLYDKKEGSYPSNIIKSVKNKINVVNIDINKLNKLIADKYFNNCLIFISADGAKKSKFLLDKFNFTIKNIEYLYKNNYNLNVFLPYISTNIPYKYPFYVFTTILSSSEEKNRNYYSYLKKLKFDSPKNLKRYDQGYRWNYPKLCLILDNLKISNDSNIETLHRLIYAILNNKTTYPYFDSKTKTIYLQFEKEDDIYFNTIMKKNVLNTSLFFFDNQGKRIYYPIQYRYGKKYNTVYIDISLKKIRVLNLNASKVKVDMIIKTYSVLKDIVLGRDILISAAKKDNLDIKMLATNEYKNFANYKLYSNTYSVTTTINVNNNLLYFPYDRQQFDITLFINQFSDKKIVPFILEKNIDPTRIESGNWLVQNVKNTYSNNIYTPKNLIDFNQDITIYKLNYLSVKIKRNNPTEIVLKYFLPAVLLVSLALYIWLRYFQEETSSNIDVVSDVLLGVISIYFIYSLLINIESLIFMDIIFFFFIAIVIIIMINFIRKKE